MQKRMAQKGQVDLRVYQIYRVVRSIPTPTLPGNLCPKRTTFVQLQTYMW